jgi:hypothetical protein
MQAKKKRANSRHDDDPSPLDPIQNHLPVRQPLLLADLLQHPIDLPFRLLRNRSQSAIRRRSNPSPFRQLNDGRLFDRVVGMKADLIDGGRDCESRQSEEGRKGEDVVVGYADGSDERPLDEGFKGGPDGGWVGDDLREVNEIEVEIGHAELGVDS